MKIRSTLGAGLAVAAVTASVAVSAPGLAATAAAPWNVRLGESNSTAIGMAVSADGSTAYALVYGASAPDGTPGPARVAPVDLSTGTAATPIDLPTTYAAGIASSGSTVAVAGTDSSGAATVWTLDGGQVGTTFPLTGPEGSNVYVNALTSGADGFVAAGSVNGCAETWSWAPGDSSATPGTPLCPASGSLNPLQVAVQPGTGTVYAAGADYADDGSTAYELWNLTDQSVAPVALSATLYPSAMTVTSDGIVYVGGSDNASESHVLRIDPSNPSSVADVDTGMSGSPSQLGLVGDSLWVGSAWGPINVLDPSGATAYTPDSPAPILVTDQGWPSYFTTTAQADYVVVPGDAAYTDSNGNGAPGLVQVLAPAAPAPKVTVSGTKATVTWNADAGSGAPIMAATVTATDTTTDKSLAPVTVNPNGDSTASVIVSGLSAGDTYTFTATQGNGFLTSQPTTTAAVRVPLPATAKPSRIAIVGTPTVGKTLTIKNTGSWATGATLTYAWYAGSKVVGTKASYALKAADNGMRIKVAVTGSSAGHSSSTVTSATVGPVTKPVYKVTRRPTITGTPKVGQTLTGHLTGLPKGATVQYQWAESFGQYGGLISRRSSKPTLAVTKSMRGGRIEVIVFVSVPGYSTGSAVSTYTALVK